MLTNAEAAGLKALKPPGLALLGFKPRAALQEWHQLKHSLFVYPSDKELKGSTTAFVALLAAMAREDKASTHALHASACLTGKMCFRMHGMSRACSHARKTGVRNAAQGLACPSLGGPSVNHSGRNPQKRQHRALAKRRHT